MGKLHLLVVLAAVLVLLALFAYLLAVHKEQEVEFEYPPPGEVVKGRIVGFTLTYWTAVNPQLLQDTLKRVKETNAKWVAILAFCRQTSKESSQVYVTKAELLLASRLAEMAKKAGFKVILYIFLRVEDGSWRGTIKPQDIGKWFETYGKVVSLYASLCEEMKLDMLCIGSELTTVETYDEEWLNVIKQARKKYSGPIVYGLNWWWSRDDLYQRIFKLKWLRELDYIGVDAYFPITAVRKPHVRDAVEGWFNNPQGRNIVAELEDLYKRFKKPLVFTEVGYRSIASALEAPWDWKRTGEYDEETQAVGFHALFKVFCDKPWVKGFIIWSWDVGYKPRAGDTSYNVHGKLAEKVISKWFKLLARD